MHNCPLFISRLWSQRKGCRAGAGSQKGQASAFNLTRDMRGEARLVERAFGVGADALTEAVQFINERLDLNAA